MIQVNISRHLAWTLLLSFTVLASTFAQTNRFAARKHIQAGDTLSYRLLVPDYDTMRKYPLVVFLHGSGERGTDNEAQLKWGAMNFATDEAMAAHQAIVLAPQCPPGARWDNFERSGNSNRKLTLKTDPSKQVRLLVDLIRQLSKQMAVDTNRIYITGLSMGGFGTFDIIQRYPNLFAAAVPVCGGGDSARAASIAHIPIWVFHGAEDPTVDVKMSDDMVNALTTAGAHPGYTRLPETGHFAWLAAYTDSLMIEWLFRQRKK
jgi:predicted peptidase